VHVAQVPNLGSVLVDSNGFVVYLFEPDKQGNPTCTGGCLQIWPALKASSSASGAGSGAQQSLVGTVSGGTQVTYNRWPLYTYSGDTAPGQASGQGINSFGGLWWALRADGSAVQASAGSTSTTRAAGGY
jgi:predicted lipoprotein with Yx(FWY)xxD motif